MSQIGRFKVAVQYTLLSYNKTNGENSAYEWVVAGLIWAEQP